MTADLAIDQLRLAREALRAGRNGRREALLTLAAASANRARLPWANDCRETLLRIRPDHLFAHFPTLDAALADPRVAHRLMRINATFPPSRVRRLLLAVDTLTGPFTGRTVAIESLLYDLLPPPPPAQQPPSRPLGLTFPIPPLPDNDDLESLAHVYTRVLLNLALLLQGLLAETAENARAA